MKKRTLLVCLILVACTALWAGGNAEATAAADAKANLTVSWWGNQQRNEITQNVIDSFMEANPNVVIDGQFNEWADYWNKLATSAAGNALPDVIQMDYKYINQYETNGLLLDLAPYIKDGTLDLSNIPESVSSVATEGDKVYGMMIATTAPALLYNKNLLDSIGITVKDHMSIDEFITIAREVYKKTGIKTNIDYGDSENYLDYYMRSKGHILYTDGGLGVPSAQDFVPFFRIYEEGIKEGWMVSPSIFVERVLRSVEQDPLVYGSSNDARSWCAFFWANQIPATQKAANAEKFEVGVTNWPSDNHKLSNYLKPSQFMVISSKSKNPREAVQFLNYWLNSETAGSYLLCERGVPVSSKIGEHIAPMLDEINQKVVKYINTVVAPKSSPVNPPSPIAANEASRLLGSLREQVCYGKITAEQAAQQFFTEANKILAK